ncbi:MAG: ornithine cyclodeaminase family protein [Anaerolineae bacterium]
MARVKKMPKYRILTDKEVEGRVAMADLIAQIEAAMLEKAEGALIAPPRFRVDVERGGLVFTVGADTKDRQVIGFRVYDSFRNASQDKQQLVAVFDSETGAFKGAVLGNRLGPLRTGAIGGVAVKHLSRPDSRVLALIGSGSQARTQLEAAVEVRDFEKFRVYSRTPAHRRAFAAEMGERLGIEIKPVTSSEKAVRGADVVIAATTATRPVLEAEWLKEGAHVSTLGPKAKGSHEIPMELAERAALIATDSLAQVDAYPKPFFLTNTHRPRMVELSDILAERVPGRTDEDQLTLFCSVGLAGTEVVVADEMLRRKRRTRAKPKTLRKKKRN